MDKPQFPVKQQCHVCFSESLDIFPEYSELSRVTSDCKPWSKNGELAICIKCNTVQKIINANWKKDVEQIYSKYQLYEVASGVEQQVFNQNTGTPINRSTMLFEHADKICRFTSHGSLLDVGYGNGAVFKAFYQIRPGWKLYGTELNPKQTEMVRELAGVQELFSSPIRDIPGNFDLITAVHVLEHVPNPKQIIREAASLLPNSGRLLIQVPNFVTNPFDLLVADHSSHFTIHSLQRLFENSPLSTISISDKIIPKEITLIAGKENTADKTKGDRSDHILIERQLKWLLALRNTAKNLADREGVAIFGTAIAAAWLFGELQGKAQFFVDEDPDRVGKIFLGRPVMHPNEVKNKVPIIMTLPLLIATTVAARLTANYPRLELILPPEGIL